MQVIVPDYFRFPGLMGLKRSETHEMPKAQEVRTRVELKAALNAPRVMATSIKPELYIFFKKVEVNYIFLLPYVFI